MDVRWMRDGCTMCVPVPPRTSSGHISVIDMCYRTWMVMYRDGEWMHVKSPDLEQCGGTLVYVRKARFESLNVVASPGRATRGESLSI